MSQVPDVAAQAVLVHSETLNETEHPPVRGVDFNQHVTLDSMMEAFLTTGFQSTEVGRAVHEINRMRKWRLSDEPVTEQEEDEYKDPEVRRSTKCRIFLSFTSNMISSGCRETIRFLVQHKMVDVLTTTAGGIEEDIMKCIKPHYLGDFSKFKGPQLRKRGINRIGNLLVPNANYCAFEDFINPILNKMMDEQEQDGVVWTPSSMIHRLGKEINHPDSVYYWAYKNNIPVYCPAITDGSVGDMLYFFSYRRPGFILDIAQDIRGINDQAIRAKCTGMIILGGGLVKHHTCNANLMRNGANFSVFINTGQEFDGSDSGAKPDEAISWGKIKIDATPVKVCADAALVFPLIVSQTFAKERNAALGAAAAAAVAGGGGGSAAAAVDEAPVDADGEDGRQPARRKSRIRLGADRPCKPAGTATSAATGPNEAPPAAAGDAVSSSSGDEGGGDVRPSAADSPKRRRKPSIRLGRGISPTPRATAAALPPDAQTHPEEQLEEPLEWAQGPGAKP